MNEELKFLGKFKKKMGGGEAVRLGRGGRDGCERRIEVFVRIRKKIGWGSGGVGGGVGFGGGGQGGCERRIEVFVKIQKKIEGGVRGGPGGRVGGSGRI